MRQDDWWYDAQVDANSGRVVSLADWVADATYLVRRRHGSATAQRKSTQLTRAPGVSGHGGWGTPSWSCHRGRIGAADWRERPERWRPRRNGGPARSRSVPGGLARPRQWRHVHDHDCACLRWHMAGHRRRSQTCVLWRAATVDTRKNLRAGRRGTPPSRATTCTPRRTGAAAPARAGSTISAQTAATTTRTSLTLMTPWNPGYGRVRAAGAGVCHAHAHALTGWPCRG